MPSCDKNFHSEIGALHAVDLVEVAVNLGDPPGELDHVAAADALLVGGAEGARGAVHEVGAEGVRDLAPLGRLDQVLAAQPGKVTPHIFAPGQILGLKTRGFRGSENIFSEFPPMTREPGQENRFPLLRTFALHCRRRKVIK